MLWRVSIAAAITGDCPDRATFGNPNVAELVAITLRSNLWWHGRVIRIRRYNRGIILLIKLLKQLALLWVILSTLPIYNLLHAQVGSTFWSR